MNAWKSWIQLRALKALEHGLDIMFAGRNFTKPVVDATTCVEPDDLSRLEGEGGLTAPATERPGSANRNP